MEFSCSQRFQPNLWKEALSSFTMWSHHNSLLFRSLLVNKYMLIIVQLLKDSKFDFFLLTSCLIALKMAPYVFLNVFPRITGISVQKNKPRLGYMSSSWLCEIGLICTDLLCLQWLVLETEKMLETDVESIIVKFSSIVLPVYLQNPCSRRRAGCHTDIFNWARVNQIWNSICFSDQSL